MQDYSFYLWKISGATVFTVWGIVAIALFACGLYCMFTSRHRVALLASLIALGSFTKGIYSAEYSVPEDIDVQRRIINQDDWESCGVGMANPTPSGRGMSNPCGYGCFRGATIRKIMTMGEFPPWPRFQREVECWHRKGPWEAHIKAIPKRASSDASAK